MGGGPSVSLRGRLAVGVLALALAAGGCASAGGGGASDSGASSSDAAVRVEVDNGNTSDVVVYALSGGQYYRLGDVVAHDRTTLRLPRHLTQATDVRLVVDPIGARNAFFSEEILFSPGDVLVLDVGPTMNLSSVSVRSGARGRDGT